MSAIGMLADRLTNSLNNPLSGRGNFAATLSSCRTGYSYGSQN